MTPKECNYHRNHCTYQVPWCYGQSSLNKF